MGADRAGDLKKRASGRRLNDLLVLDLSPYELL